MMLLLSTTPLELNGILSANAFKETIAQRRINVVFMRGEILLIEDYEYKQYKNFRVVNFYLDKKAPLRRGLWRFYL